MPCEGLVTLQVGQSIARDPRLFQNRSPTKISHTNVHSVGSNAPGWGPWHPTACNCSALMQYEQGSMLDHLALMWLSNHVAKRKSFDSPFHRLPFSLFFFSLRSLLIGSRCGFSDFGCGR